MGIARGGNCPGRLVEVEIAGKVEVGGREFFGHSCAHCGIAHLEYAYVFVLKRILTNKDCVKVCTSSKDKSPVCAHNQKYKCTQAVV